MARDLDEGVADADGSKTSISTANDQRSLVAFAANATLLSQFAAVGVGGGLLGLLGAATTILAVALALPTTEFGFLLVQLASETASWMPATLATVLSGAATEVGVLAAASPRVAATCSALHGGDHGVGVLDAHMQAAHLHGDHRQQLRPRRWRDVKGGHRAERAVDLPVAEQPVHADAEPPAGLAVRRMADRVNRRTHREHPTHADVELAVLQ